MKFLPLLLLIVGCTSLTTAVSGPTASVTQDGVSWNVHHATIVGLAPVDTITLYRQEKPDTNVYSILRWVTSIPIPGTYSIHAQFLDCSLPDTVVYAGDGKMVVSEVKHVVTDFNIRVTDVNDTLYYKTILFKGHVER